MIDWAATGSMIGALASWAGVAAVVYAAWRAANTIDGFRQEKLFERRLETADDVLTLAYRIKRNLAAVRSPMSGGNESEAAHEILKGAKWYQSLPEDKQRQAQQGQLIRLRLKRYDADWERIFDVMPKARAYFGEDVEAQLQKLWQQVTRVNVSADMYSTDKRTDHDFTTKIEQDMWDMGMTVPERNPIGVAVDEAIDSLESVLLPILRDPSLGTSQNAHKPQIASDENSD